MSELPHDCMQRIRSGDVQAFEALYRVMHVRLVAFAARYLGDVSRAEELVQDLFFDIWSTRGTWKESGSLNSYLYAAVRNRALNVRRRDGVEQSWAEDEAHEPVRTLHTAPERADTLLERAEMAVLLAEAFARLPGRCALVMQMRWHGGLSYSEIAETLGISQKGVENQLSRGLKALRAALDPD